MVDVNQASTQQGTGQGTARARLRRADRLRSSKDYRRVNRTGVRRAGANFVVQRAPGRDPVRPALGLVVSRRVGNAVSRNRVKRRIREWFRAERSLFEGGEDVVVIARTGAADLDGPAVARELTELVRP